MRRNDYLKGDVARFCEWLSQRLGGQPIHFSITGNYRQFSTLVDALNAYSWPQKKVSGRPNPDGKYPYIHPTVPTLAAKSTLADNTAVLDVIQKALRTAYFNVPATNDTLSGAVAATLHWGGVYKATRYGGNKPWLAQNHVNLLSILQDVVNDHALGDDESGVTALRFNAGMTKVYSLLIDDFIIYDSRVAAALAWLALKWWTAVEGKPQSQLHEHLRFLCLPGNGKALSFATLHPRCSRPTQPSLMSITDGTCEPIGCCIVPRNWRAQTVASARCAKSRRRCFKWGRG